MERLLNYFKPENYHLKLFIDKHAGIARGEATITGEALATTVKLHAKGLKIEQVLVNGVNVSHHLIDDELIIENHKGILRDSAEPGKASSSAISPVATAQRSEREREFNRSFPSEAAPSQETGEIDACRGKRLVILVCYSFTLNTNMMGCYLSTYDYKGREERLVSTQFESHYARECFPCIDEPAAKATFDLEISVPDADDTILANTPVKKTLKSAANVVENTTLTPKTTPENVVKNTTKSAKTVIFETTPKMSTYLLAFCIGRFQSKTVKSKHGVKVTTYCALNQDPALLDFPNGIAAASLDYYDDQFGIPYPLPKLDQVAIPDFEAGAMENWGLVTYREACLLAGEKSSISTREYVATVIAHELSHQWFGNLVTMEWWNNLWLNESFANLMEYLCVDAIHPEYKILENFFVGECRAALGRDSLAGVQAVQQEVEDPAEIATLFDGAIVYAKGSRLMFMLYRLMGARSFFAGLKEYFKTHQYGNTTGDDLWRALQPHAKFDVKEFMDAWILQPGYPVITDDHQQRFLLSGATDDTTWPLPKITDDMSGHYLLNISAEEFAAKLERFGDLTFEQKVRLLLDRSLLAKTAIVSTALHFDLLPHFREETDDMLWAPISTLISDLKLFFPYSDPDFAAFQGYILYVVKPQLDRLGVVARPNEPESDTKLRPSILGYALFTEDQETTEQLAKLYRSDYTKLDPETRDSILFAKLRLDEDKMYPELLEKYQTESDPELKDDILDVLTYAKYHTKELVSLLKKPKIVKPQDHLYLFVYLLQNHVTRNAAMDWLYENWEYVEKMTGEKSLEDYPRILASTIRTRAEADRFFDFFAPHSEDPVLKRTLEVAKSDIEARLKLIADDSPAVHQKLAS